MYITVVNEILHAKPLIHISTRNTTLRGRVLNLWNWRTQTSEAIHHRVSQMHVVINLPTKSPKLHHHNHWSLQFDSTLNNINWACSFTIQSPESTLVLSFISLSLSLSLECFFKKKTENTVLLHLYMYTACPEHTCFMLYNDWQHNTLNTKELPSFCIFYIPQPTFLHVLQSSVQNNITSE